MRHVLALALCSFVVGGCGSPRPAAPPPVGPCRSVAGPLPVTHPSFEADGSITMSVAPAVPIAADDVQHVSRGDSLVGSTTTSFVERGDLAAAPPPACVYTLVTPTASCLLAPTGRFWASRGGHQPHGTSEALTNPWSITYELRNAACVATLTTGRDTAVLVAGVHPDMRVVRFGMDVSYAGGVGEDSDYAGADLRPTIATWPADEQQRYRRGPGFAARPSLTPDGHIARDLTWFTSLADNFAWSSRLRDRSGRTVLAIESDFTPAVLRDGDALYWAGGAVE